MSCAGEWQTQLSRQQIKALRRQRKEEGGEGGGREATNLTSPEGTQGETEAKGESEGELLVAMVTYSTTCLIIIMNRFEGGGGEGGGRGEGGGDTLKCKIQQSRGCTVDL